MPFCSRTSYEERAQAIASFRSIARAKSVRQVVRETASLSCLPSIPSFIKRSQNSAIYRRSVSVMVGLSGEESTISYLATIHSTNRAGPRRWPNRRNILGNGYGETRRCRQPSRWGGNARHFRGAVGAKEWGGAAGGGLLAEARSKSKPGRTKASVPTRAFPTRASKRVGILRLRLVFALSAQRPILAQDDNNKNRCFARRRAPLGDVLRSG